MADIVLSSSSRFYPIVISLRDALAASGLDVLTPDLEFVTRTVTPEEKRDLTLAFFKKIERSKVVCLVTDDTGYVGRSVSMEVGFAFARGIPIVSLEQIEDAAIAALCTRLLSVDALEKFVRSRSLAGAA
jgi:nucleoside 2-deoxyribosyltransferase